MDIAHEKFDKLKKLLESYKRVAIAFSGGVDSTFLLKAAKDVLGENVLAITARSLSFPRRELNEAEALTEKNGISHFFVDLEELEIEGFSQNPDNRCYICKKELFRKIISKAAEKGINIVAEASNADDEWDYRPGLKAIGELGVKSPLREVRLTKEEIRRLSREMALPTWDKPSFACLATRIPYGEPITREKLKMIDEAEQFLFNLGFYQVRVRYHGNLARIETDEKGIEQMMKKQRREEVYLKLREIGFKYVSLDLMGYRTGSMNETLQGSE